MSEYTELELELERRLTILETEEAADPVHAATSGRSLALFLTVAAVLVILPALWVAL